MSFGSLSLMKPIQSYGRVTTFQGTTGPGGSSLKGHVYSTPLPTALVAQKVPIQPGNSVVRVLFDEETCCNLPDKDTSPDVYLVDPVGLQKVKEKEPEKQNVSKSGGDSLLRSTEEEMDSIMISCTVTIREKDSPNQNQELLNQLDSTATTSFQLLQTLLLSVLHKSLFRTLIYPDYLETRYPDLFPFGRAGFDEKRKIKISKKALIAYYTNLSTRQFQKPDFILPVYDMIARNSSYNMAIVRANLPSREINKDGNVISRAEAYSRIPLEDLRQLAEYQSICIKHQLLGKRAPRPPASSSGLSSTFFTDQKISNQALQHSQAAAQRNRQDVYAAHANNGKANIWLTISQDDAKSFKVLWYALDPKESAPSANAIPQGSKHIIGWSLQKSRPFKKGGLFGISKAWLRVVEEQSRLTLHTHMLIWLYGHSEIENQLTTALKRDEEHLRDLFHLINSPEENSRPNRAPKTYQWDVWDRLKNVNVSQIAQWVAGWNSVSIVYGSNPKIEIRFRIGDIRVILMMTLDDSGDITQMIPGVNSAKDPNYYTKFKNVKLVTDKLCENITNMIEGELILPEEEMDFVIKCTSCKEEHLEVTSNTDLEIARTPGKDF
uniref:Helitron helicase-like domain-containing protein n=1 Tax=Daphnia galeata TaxID=27404 RepID=A0A8J2S332_9CRUS|nr:unnamed protein product [Daphnia galeata]